MSSNPIRRSSSASAAESPVVKKPVASVKEAPRGDFVSIHSRSVLADKLEEIANLANEATAADGIAIALLDDDQFLCRASLGFAPEKGVAVEPGQGVCGQCLAESRLVLAQDLTGEIKSALAAPVVIDGKVHGLIAAFSFRTGAFAASHSDLLCCLASDIAQGLDSFDSIHLVTPESLEFAPAREPELQPRSRDERLAIIEAVTSPLSSPVFDNPSDLSLTSGTTLQSAPSVQAASNPELHFTGYADQDEEVGENWDDGPAHRPFRNHWDIVVILAAILIAVLTFGIWLRHRHNTPYTGQITHRPATSLACVAHNPTLIPSKVC